MIWLDMMSAYIILLYPNRKDQLTSQDEIGMGQN